MRSKFIAALALASLLVMTACTPAPIVNIPSASVSAGTEPLVVGIPQLPDATVPSEGVLLAHVYAAALNAAGVESGVGAAPIKNGELAAELESGTVDVVPVFSRLALAEMVSAGTGQNGAGEGSSEEGTGDQGVDSLDPGAVLAALKKSLPAGVLQLDPSKVEDHSNLVVTAVTAEKYQLKSIADAAKVCDQLKMGGTAEFKTATAGLAKLAGDYKCEPKLYESLEPSLAPGSNSIFWALLQDRVQLALIPNSSPAIVDNALVVLSDPQQLFPTQTVVPLVVEKSVGNDVQDVLNKVSAVLNTEELGNLNRLSKDRHYGNVSEVAQAWLIQKGLLKAAP